MDHLQTLSLASQGKDILITDLSQTVFDFEAKRSTTSEYFI